MTSTPQQLQGSGVIGLALNKRGEFLITLRNDPDNSMAHNKWQIPGGGVEFGETPEQTLAREMQEELSLSVQIIYPRPIVRSWVWDHKRPHSHILLLCYLIDIGQQKPKLDQQENIDLRWIRSKDVHNLDFLPLTDEFVLEAQELVMKENLINKLA